MSANKKDMPGYSPSPRLVARGKSQRIISIGHRRNWLGDGYARMLAASWKKLIGGIVVVYLAANFIFASLYLMLGDGIEHASPGSFADAFFFSVQTMATIGYGNMWPKGLAANLLVTVQAFTGFCFFAVMTGLVFSKFSRPTSRVIFSHAAVICPYNGKPHLMLRLANERGNRIVDATIRLVVLWNEISAEGIRMRRFRDLTLVRSQVPLLQLTWTVMHPVDESSPLYNMSGEMLCEKEAEIIVSLVGIDETLSQTIHARYSYAANEIVFGAVFEDILHRRPDGRTEVHYHKFHSVKPI